MLDIEYIKQIDEILEVEGWDFHYKPHEPKLGGGYLDYYERRCSIFGLSMPNSIMYELYLVRVIEAINKREDYEIHQTRSNIIVFSPGGSAKPFDFEFGKEDEAKESAIIWVMDHIKEKV